MLTHFEEALSVVFQVHSLYYWGVIGGLLDENKSNLNSGSFSFLQSTNKIEWKSDEKLGICSQSIDMKVICN